MLALSDIKRRIPLEIYQAYPAVAPTEIDC
jgi:hypothetical protein